MSTLTDIEKRYLEKLLGMQSGYVLDYSDKTFEAFFKQYNIEIHHQKYQTYGTSKAKKLRSFWEQEPDGIVARTLSDMIDSYVATCDFNNQIIDVKILNHSREIVKRMSNAQSPDMTKTDINDDFLLNEFNIPNIKNLPINPQAMPIIESRLTEARKALNAGAYLSVIFFVVAC